MTSTIPETNFPEKTTECERTGGCPFPYYDSDLVEDWFKRMIDDFPEKTLFNENGIKVYYYKLVDSWATRWLHSFGMTKRNHWIEEKHNEP